MRTQAKGMCVAQQSAVGRYRYWSDRRVQAVAEEVGVALDSDSRWTVTLGLPMLQLQFGKGTRAPNRLRTAEKVLKALGSLVATDFNCPAPVQYARGTGQVAFAEFVGTYASNDGMLCHIRTQCGEGRRVDVVLFGSMENLDGFRVGDAINDGWVSSAAPAIEELLRSRGAENTSQWDDDQSRAMEALKIAVQQGTRPNQDHEGHPWTRGHTLGHDNDAEWCAEIYADVVLDDTRWDLERDPDLAETHRIIVGAPLWVRSLRPDALVRYRGGEQGRIRRIVGRRPAIVVAER